MRPFETCTGVWLDGTAITDADLNHFSGLSSVRELSLQNTKVTDAALNGLAGLTQLQTLNLSSTQVTDAGLKESKKALPKCRISGQPIRP